MKRTLFLSNPEFMSEQADRTLRIARQGISVVGAFNYGSELDEQAQSAYAESLVDSYLSDDPVDCVMFHEIADHQVGIAGVLWVHASKLRVPMTRLHAPLRRQGVRPILGGSPIIPKGDSGLGLRDLCMVSSALPGVGIKDDRHLREGIN